MRTTHLATAGGFALTLILAAPAMAQQGQQSQGMGGQAGQNPSFSQLDKNKDGYISEKEARGDKQLYNHWGRFDTNGDKRISPSEFSAFEAGGGTGQIEKGRQGSSGAMQQEPGGGMGGGAGGQQ